MKLLAMETSGRVLSLAGFEAGGFVKEITVEAPARQNESLAPLLKSLLEDLAWKAADLGAIAISLGPGSFSGLRSGLAFAKGLAYANGVELLGVPTLEAWAECAGAQALVWLDARHGQIYRGAYRDGVALVTPAMLDLAVARAESFPGCAHVGDVEGLAGRCSAESVGRLALKRLALQGRQDRQAPVAGLEPIYLRRAEVELLWEKRHV
jgi:tRNA threonylcarbamoyladenosine biosynthesis protein TsaB